jgi:hypothetical protein
MPPKGMPMSKGKMPMAPSDMMMMREAAAEKIVKSNKKGKK